MKLLLGLLFFTPFLFNTFALNDLYSSSAEGYNGHAYIVGPKIIAVSNLMTEKLGISNVNSRKDFLRSKNTNQVKFPIFVLQEDAVSKKEEILSDHSSSSFQSVSRRFN